MGVTLILLTALIILILFVFFILHFIVTRTKYGSKAEIALDKLKQKLFYGPFIQYSQLNALKLNMILFLALKNADNETAQGFLAFAIAIQVIGLSLLYFTCLFYKHKKHLLEEE